MAASRVPAGGAWPWSTPPAPAGPPDDPSVGAGGGVWAAAPTADTSTTAAMVNSLNTLEVRTYDHLPVGPGMTPFRPTCCESSEHTSGWGVGEAGKCARAGVRGCASAQ